MTKLDKAGKSTNQIPEFPELAAALKAAGAAHHEYEQTVLNGVFDEHWPMFYAAFVLGRFGEFTKPSTLTSWLKEAPTNDVWAESAATYVLNGLSKQ